ncbi:c-type cytochrome biogenesis protein CcmI [Zavarzinia sp.]|uniref:c-type cytochrome biogenesis protein CcmI n=1 Tax=Zavarzinia sp. TaxID=2027920 RepID=UPI00356498A5
MMLAVFGLIAAAVAILLLRPLLRPAHNRDAAAAERAVYRAQLDELAAEQAAGGIGADEVAAAKLEIERRLLKVSEATKASGRPSLVLALVVAIGVPAGGALLYDVLGANGLGDAPLAPRLTAAGQMAETERLIAELEKRMVEHPEDPRGWILLARARAAEGKLIPAAEAYEKVIGLMPDSVDARLGAAELRIAAAQGVVTPEAKALIDQALTLEPKNAGARHFAAYAKFAAGDKNGAADDWQALLPELTADDPLRDAVVAGLAAAGRPVPEVPPAASAAPGPSAGDVAAAQEMTPEQRQAMIESMVERLAARLKAQPDDLQGWLKLARAYDVLGKAPEAVAAWEKAAALKPDDAEIQAGLTAARAKAAAP